MREEAVTDGDRLRELAAEVRSIGASRACIGNELTVMACTDLAIATDELATWLDRDDAGAVQEFAAESTTARLRLRTQPGVGR